MGVSNKAKQHNIMDKTIIVSIIGGIVLISSNILTAILTSRFTSKREKNKSEADLKLKIAEFAVENPEKLIELEKKLAIGIIIVETPEIRHRKYIIPNNRIQIGRCITCDIILDNIYISNEHCAIYSNDRKVYIEDLLSTNGTYLNEKLINSKYELNDGDEVRIQDVVVKYKKL
jgi:hypothetical protein